MGIEIRKVKSDEMDQAIKLADTTFRDADHASMGDAYPHIFSPGIIHSFGAFDGDKLVSFIGLVPNIIHIGPATLNIFSIGSVCTDLDYRRQGISSKILKEVYDYIDEAGSSILIVSGDRGMYRRNHCHYFGEDQSYTIKQLDDKVATYEGEIRAFKDTDLFQLDQLRKEKAVYFEGSLLEWSILFAAEGYTGNLKMNQSIYVAENNGKIEGYIALGLPNAQSLSQKGIITDWAGDKAVVHKLITHVLKIKNLPAIEFNMPSHEEFAAELVAYPMKELEKDNTLYLVDAARLVDQVKPYLLEKNLELAETLEITKIDEQNYSFTAGETTLRLDVEALITLLFGADKELQKGELATLFPIPLPYMGGIFFV